MESSIPQVSVIIPLYNKAPYIKRALDSVLAQKVQDFEIVVVNDGSKDGGEKIVEEYADTRIRLINQENQGVSAARNHGVDVASAELVAFLDADDEWLPEFLETILRLRRKWPEAGLYGTGYQYNMSDTVWKRQEICSELGERTINLFYLMNRHGVPIMTSGMAIPRSLFLSIGGFNCCLKHSEDFDLRSRIALMYLVAYSPNICAIYWLETQSNTTYLHQYLQDAFYPYVLSCGILNELDFNEIQELTAFCEGRILYLSRRNIRDAPKKYSQNIVDDLNLLTSKKLVLKKNLLILFAKLMPISSCVLYWLTRVYHLKQLQVIVGCLNMYHI